MERFNALGRGAQLMLVGSVLLLIDTFFHWQEVTIKFLGASASSGVNAWHGFWGVAMGLLTIVLIAWLVARLAAVDVPVPPSLTGAVLAFLIFAFALIKNLSDDYSTFWAWVGVALGVVIAVGGWLQVQESGGVENLRSEASSITGAATGAGAAGGAAATAPGAAESSEPASAAGGAAAAAEQAPESAAGDATSSGAEAVRGTTQTAESAAGGAEQAASSAAGEAAGTTGETAAGAADETAEAPDDLLGGPSTGSDA